MKALFILFLGILFHGSAAQSFTWTSQNSTVSHTLNDLYFTSNQEGWVIGINGTILNTSDGGLTWLTQNSGTTEPLFSVFFANNLVGWAAGGSNNALLLKTSNGGQTWTAMTTGISSGPILDVAFAPGAQAGYAITADSIYTTTNGGLNWTNESYAGVIGTAVNKAIALLSATEAFVGGRRFQTGIQDSSPEVYDRRNATGTYTWGPTTANQFANMDRLESITFSNQTTGFAGGIQGKLYRMQATLPVISGPWNVCFDLGGGNNQTINSISFISDSTGIFSTPKQIGMTKYSLIYHTSDAGDTWLDPDTITNFLINQLQYVDMTTAWAVGVNGKIYKATNPFFSLDENHKPPKLLLYPNPANDWLTLTTENINLERIKISVYNSLGQLITVKYNVIDGEKALIPLQAIQPGIYFIKLETTDGSRIFKRFIKM